ncbi:DUF6735 family protein [Halorientalis halophila]|uniref:DUF6735 family protein n=1 Tax=Halorientalis halophila TaxID=3108499 RepID=UPI0030084822
MGQRALLAVERATDRYDLHYAHWGAHDWQLASILADRPPSDRLDVAALARRAGIDPTPVATGSSFAAVVTDHLDYQTYDACYVVDADGALSTYLVAWFGLPGHDAVRPRDGALVGVDPGRVEPDGEFLRGRVAGLKAAVLALVRADRLVVPAGRSLLASEVRAWRAEDRTVHLGPDADPEGWAP